MKRRSFLQLLGLTTIAPTAILAKADEQKYPVTTIDGDFVRTQYSETNFSLAPINREPIVFDGVNNFLKVKDTLIYDRPLSKKEIRQVLSYLDGRPT